MRVVLDANIYVGAEVSPRGVCSKTIKIFTEPGSAFKLITTEKILSEVYDVLCRPRIMRLTQQDATEVGLAIEAYAQLATVVPDISISAKECRDPKDVIYLAAAHTARATLIVSLDKDLLDLFEYKESKIIKPDIFIKIASQIY